jgi:hypothetical protein
MKESLYELEQFINDFKLRQSPGVIAFTATIHFNNDGQTKTEESEVHVITSDNIGAIYFLSIDGQAVPDMFSVRDHKFSYNPGKCLHIESPVYSVAVFPKTQSTSL